MTFNAAGDRVTVGERMENLAQAVPSVGSGDVGYARLAVMARTAAVNGLLDPSGCTSAGQGNQKNGALSRSGPSSTAQYSQTTTTEIPTVMPTLHRLRCRISGQPTTGLTAIRIPWCSRQWCLD